MIKRTSISALILSLAFVIIGMASDEKKPAAEKNFYESSLHYTAKGLEYWYSKAQGGLETITGIPFSELPCAGCHVRSCDTCHTEEVNGKPAYSVETARTQEACRRCHGLEPQEFAMKNPGDPTADVHFGRGMKCLDCHTSREVHGDGTPYNSVQDPGALDAKCENCHESLSQGESHTAHQGKVDCNACHVRNVSSCYNCHFETRIKEGKSLSMPLKNLLFLVNHDGRVTLASFHTFVYQNKTMVTFAPAFPHWVMKEGRKCADCHATEITRAMKKNKFKPVVFEKGELKNVTGIIPVLEGWKWDFIFFNHVNGSWVPLEKAAEPLVHFSGYSTPLTPEQFAKLEKAPVKKPAR